MSKTPFIKMVNFMLLTHEFAVLVILVQGRAGKHRASIQANTIDHVANNQGYVLKNLRKEKMTELKNRVDKHFFSFSCFKE